MKRTLIPINADKCSTQTKDGNVAAGNWSRLFGWKHFPFGTVACLPKEGMTEVWMNGNWILPCACYFCVNRYAWLLACLESGWLHKSPGRQQGTKHLLACLSSGLSRPPQFFVVTQWRSGRKLVAAQILTHPAVERGSNANEFFKPQQSVSCCTTVLWKAVTDRMANSFTRGQLSTKNGINGTCTHFTGKTACQFPALKWL